MELNNVNCSPLGFEIEGVERYYDWYALFKYNPLQLIFSLNKDDEAMQKQELLTRFKGGDNPHYFASLFVDSIIQNPALGPDFLSDKWIWKLPTNKDKKDYNIKIESDNCFCEEIKKLQSVKLENRCLTGAFMDDLLSYKNGFELGIAGKEFVLFDDVRYSGYQAQKLAVLLKSKGVKKVHCFYLSALQSY